MSAVSWNGPKHSVIRPIVTGIAALLAASAAAEESAGTAMAVIELANAAGQAGDRPLAASAAIYLGDLVQTDANGQAPILFKDQTRMAVCPDASLRIEAFLFRADAPENMFTVRALGGGFRFISGETKDENYEIRTPTGAISIRGTAIDFTVSDTFGVELVLLNGIAQVCDQAGQCAIASLPSDLIQAAPNNSVREVRPDEGRALQTRRRFPNIADQSTLLGEFRLDRRGRGADPPSAGGRGGGGADGTSGNGN